MEFIMGVSCATCEHCDTLEAVRIHGQEFVGICTKQGAPFQDCFVPGWPAGCCPDYQPIALPQADGDHGEDDAA